MGLDLLRLSNELRRDYGVVSFLSLETSGLFVRVVTPASSYLISSRDEIPKLSKQSQFYEEMIQRLRTWDVIEKAVSNCLASRSIGEFDLLMACSKLSDGLFLGDVFLEKGKIVVLGHPFSSRENLLNDLPNIIKKSRAMFSVQASFIDKLLELSTDVIYLQKGKALLLDEIAYVADCAETLCCKKEKYPMEGYVTKTGIKWESIDKSRFKNIETTHGSIQILDLLYHCKDITVMRERRPWERRKVGESPYPIALLEDGGYAYFYKKK